MTNNREARAMHGEVRASARSAEDKGLRFEGYAALFNEWSQNLGGFREQIAPGAFSKAVAADDIRALFNHDSNYVLGRTRSGTLRLWEDEKGLAFELDAPDTTWARDLHESVTRGDVSQCSFGFETVTDEWRQVDGLDERTLKEVKLFDVSIVTFPAYTATSAHARSAAEVLQAHREAVARETRPRGVPVSVLRRKLDLMTKESESNGI